MRGFNDAFFLGSEPYQRSRNLAGDDFDVHRVEPVMRVGAAMNMPRYHVDAATAHFTQGNLRRQVEITGATGHQRIPFGSLQ